MIRLALLAALLATAGWSCTDSPITNTQTQLNSNTEVIANQVSVELVDNVFVLLDTANIEQSEPLFSVEVKPEAVVIPPDRSYLVEQDAQALRFYRFSDHAITRLHEAGVQSVELSPSGRTISYIVESETGELRTLKRDVSISGEVTEPYADL